ncbi:unnamed protein product [Owenia fusiformis]|uniref:Uncharacterized protein n=1 Tax=Owenia fusiformis TaxID=6347 RepID=A0A8J1TDN7_OWEFU|nr:unnamed protein product [Owenia fusiformis]
MKGLAKCYVFIALIVGRYTVAGDRCGNPDCSPITDISNGVAFQECPEVSLGTNCDVKVQYAMTTLKYPWTDNICQTLGSRWKYAIDSQDNERHYHMLQVATSHSWIGLQKTNTWEESVWLDGTPYSTTWNRWDGSDDSSTCLELAEDEWHSHGCGDSKNVLCQKIFGCDDTFPADTNADIENPGTVETYYNNVKYTCHEGFFIGGEVNTTAETIQCRNNVWDDHTPCEYPPCSDPPNDISATISLSSPAKTIGTIATYVCHNGYSIGGGVSSTFNETMTCLEGGAWSNTHTPCGKRSCGTPESYNGASVTPAGTLYTDKANYLCDTGFKTQNNQMSYTVECLANAIWNYTERCRLVDCGSALLHFAAHITFQNGTLYENTIEYTCNPGYEMDPTTGETQDEIKCQASGIWSNLTSSCQKKNCGEPIADENALSIVKDGTHFQDNANYTCSPGYRTGGTISEIVYCDEGGSWTHHTPCLPVVCPAPPTDQNAEVDVNGLNYNETTVYTCHVGHYLDGLIDFPSELIRCSEDAQWTPNHAPCMPVSCGNPDDDPNAVEVVNGTLYNDTMSYECNNGYVLSDSTDMVNRIITCLSNGIWESHALCTPIDCGNPPVDINAFVSISGTVYEDTVRYDCSTGYRLGSSTPSSATYDVIHCLSNGHWSDHSPCSRVPCGSLPIDQDATVIAGNMSHLDGSNISNLFNDRVIFICNSGYVINGTTLTNETVYCTDTGNWSEHTSCVRRLCGPPQIDNNALMLTTDHSYSYESTAFYTCHIGYWMNGTTSDTITCQADGTWEDRSRCIIISCSDPPIDKNANTTKRITHLHNDPMNSYANLTQGETFLYNDTVLYSCRDGYTISGRNSTSETIHCGHGGKWSAHSRCVKPTPSCYCGPLSKDLNAEQVDPRTNYACMDEVLFRCKDGFHIYENETSRTYESVLCLPNATWSQRTYCKSISGDSWVRAKKITFPSEEAAGAVVIGSVGLIILLTVLTIVVLSDLQRICSHVKNIMIKNVRAWTRKPSAHFKYKRTTET